MPLQEPDIEYLMNEARANLVGASDSGIRMELFNVIKEFLQDTNAWVEHIELMVTAGTQDYTLLPRTGGQIIRLVGAYNGLRSPVRASMPTFGRLEVLDPIQTTSVAQAASDTSRKATTPWLVVVVKNIALPKTSDGFPICPEFVLKVYSTYIKDGLFGKMMAQSARGYSNTALSIYHLKRFRDGISIARDAAWTQNILGGQRWTFPQNFSTHSQRSGYSTAWPAETF